MAQYRFKTFTVKLNLYLLLENGFTVGEIAQMLFVSKRTVENRMREYEIRVHDFYCTISDEELDSRVVYYIQTFPNSGRSNNSRVQAEK